jgi:hypothetical protein
MGRTIRRRNPKIHPRKLTSYACWACEAPTAPGQVLCQKCRRGRRPA